MRATLNSGLGNQSQQTFQSRTILAISFRHGAKVWVGCNVVRAIRIVVASLNPGSDLDTISVQSDATSRSQFSFVNLEWHNKLSRVLSRSILDIVRLQ